MGHPAGDRRLARNRHIDRGCRQLDVSEREGAVMATEAESRRARRPNLRCVRIDHGAAGVRGVLVVVDAFYVLVPQGRLGVGVVRGMAEYAYAFFARRLNRPRA